VLTPLASFGTKPGTIGMSSGGVDDRKLEALLERFGGLLSATIRRACPRDLGIDTQDIEQEARVRLWRALGRATDAELGASYVKRVAATATIDAIRAALARRDRRTVDFAGTDEESPAAQGIAEPVTASSPEDERRRRETEAQIAAGLDALSPDRRRAVKLHLYGLTSPEIGRATGWTETKARTLISRGLAELRQILSEKGLNADAGS
jgi:RNA polymerase sigma-70 factor (ECF subfamily)